MWRSVLFEWPYNPGSYHQYNHYLKSDYYEYAPAQDNKVYH